MTNYPFTTIDTFSDLETLNHFATVQRDGGDEEAALAGYRFFGRDNARTPVQWDDSTEAGFTSGTPWLPVNPNYSEINAAAAVADPDSVFHHYRKLIALRHEDRVVSHGDYALLLPEDEQVYAFARTLGTEGALVVVNVSSRPATASIDEQYASLDAKPISQNYPDSPELSGSVNLRPWEAVVWRW